MVGVMYDHVESSCPNCHAALNAAERVGGNDPRLRGPEPGDIGVCWKCDMPFLFTALGNTKLEVNHLSDQQKEDLKEALQVCASRSKGKSMN